MKGTRFAEWILRRVTTRERAAAQVGDFLELAQTRGAFWFWRAVVGSTIHAGSRFAIGFLTVFSLSQLINSLWAHGRFDNHPDLYSVYTFGYLVVAPFCTLPLFLAIRFGWRDTHTRFALLFALAGFVSVLCYPHPILRWTFPAVALLTVGLALKPSRRNWTPLQTLVQMGSVVAVNLSGLALLLLTLAAMMLLDRWIPSNSIGRSTVTALATHPGTDLINATVCFLMLRTASSLQHRWQRTEPAE